MTLYVLYDKRDSMTSSPRTKGFCFLCLKRNNTQMSVQKRLFLLTMLEVKCHGC